MAATPGKANRNPALDFTKGALVLIMVLYHWINYFLGAHDNRYLRFLTPSFICITGFLISNVYLSKYGISDPHLPKRLLQRGLKILGVFLVLNLARTLFSGGSFRSQGLPDFLSPDSLINIYVVGSGVGGGQTKAVAFFVLIPIGYLLILSAILLLGSRIYRYTFQAACVLCLLATFTLYFMDRESANLELVTIGLLGVMAGYLSREKVDALVRHPYLLAAAYLVYLAAISKWNILYPLQIPGVFFSLMTLYLCGQTSGEPGIAKGIVILLGKYSLFGYIAQIAILQVLHYSLEYLDSRTLMLSVSFTAAFALTIASVMIVHRARSMFVTVDRLYQAVFA
jgi:hypothetical protein